MRYTTRFFKLLKRNFLTGILVLLPVLLILWMASWFLEYFWGFSALIPAEWMPEGPIRHLLNFISAVTGLGCVAFLISVLGWLSKLYFGQRMLKSFGRFVQRIPVLGTIYRASDQLMQAFAQTGDGGQFNRVVLMEYPKKDVWTVAFVTGESSLMRGKPHLHVFVPTVPNPTSGFFLIVPESDVRDSDLSVEEAFRTILSLGIAQPGSRPSDRRR